MKFISYYPLKQGLKLFFYGSPYLLYPIYILLSIKTRIETYLALPFITVSFLIYILLSIKTRIETLSQLFCLCASIGFISYYPLKQGLKLQRRHSEISFLRRIYILLSIKTRIETQTSLMSRSRRKEFISYYPLKQGLKH